MTDFRYRSASGFVHECAGATTGMVLTHGAGGNCQMPLLVTAASAFHDLGWTAIRCDMAFRQKRSVGAPHPSASAQDRLSLADAVAFARGLGVKRVVLGGQSYGGRQATMLAAEQPPLADALLLFSYPLHPPGKPEQLRTAHFPALRTPSLFVHGERDPFGSIEEMKAATRLIPGPVTLSVIAKAGHDLARGKFDLPGRVVSPLLALLGEG
jgi:predicted alpha/beta-hydrolase family hydrolase